MVGPRLHQLHAAVVLGTRPQLRDRRDQSRTRRASGLVTVVTGSRPDRCHILSGFRPDQPCPVERGHIINLQSPRQQRELTARPELHQQRPTWLLSPLESGTATLLTGREAAKAAPQVGGRWQSEELHPNSAPPEPGFSRGEAGMPLSLYGFGAEFFFFFPKKQKKLCFSFIGFGRDCCVLIFYSIWKGLLSLYSGF